MTKSLKWGLAVLSTIAISGCSNDDQASNNTTNAQGEQIALTLNGLEKMSGQHYEGWAVGSNGVTSTGRFNLNDSGEIVAVNSAGETLAVIGQNGKGNFSLQDSGETLTAFVLTIEPDGDNDEGPSSIHFLEGAFSNGTARATLQEDGAVGGSFLAAQGSFILATPTNGPATHNQGIWYLNSGAPSLTLPTLNGTFAYEGWIVDTTTGEVVSTGVFTQANEADSDGPGATAGVNPAPPFPGQDFINPARILNDGTMMAVISVEPVPDFDPAPFALKILALPIIDGAPVTTRLDLNNISNENYIFIEAQIN